MKLRLPALFRHCLGTLGFCFFADTGFVQRRVCVQTLHPQLRDGDDTAAFACHMRAEHHQFGGSGIPVPQSLCSAGPDCGVLVRVGCKSVTEEQHVPGNAWQSAQLSLPVWSSGHCGLYTHPAGWRVLAELSTLAHLLLLSIQACVEKNLMF